MQVLWISNFKYISTRHRSSHTDISVFDIWDSLRVARLGAKICRGVFKTYVQCIVLLRAFVGECDWLQVWETHRIAHKVEFRSDGGEQVNVLETFLIAHKISAYCEFLIPRLWKILGMESTSRVIEDNDDNNQLWPKKIKLPRKSNTPTGQNKKLRITVTVVRCSNTLCS